MINNTTARRHMYAWHGGMSSPFYQAASSGLVANWGALKDEVRQCYNTATTAKDKGQLGRLLDWVIYQHGKCANRIVVLRGIRHNILPWGKS